MKKITLLLLAILTTQFVYLQKNGTITGKIVDEVTGEDLIGVSVMVKGGNKGTATDIDGTFKLEVAPGIYDLQITYISYQTKIVEKVEVVAGQLTDPIHITLAETVNELGGHTVTATAERGTNTALILEQKNSAVMFDGISSDQMKKTPDRTTADVLRRVSGATIQDNFVVIRGLPDRYNSTYLNGASLPSSEPDRKAFSFDIFPSALLSDLKVIKTAMPSLSGEFAGGLIQVKTKEIPEKTFYQFSLGATFDLISTFKDFKLTQQGNTDFFGIDDGTRGLQPGTPSNADMTYFQNNFYKDTLVYVAKNFFNNNYKVNTTMAAPGANFQFSMGHNINLIPKLKRDISPNKAEIGSIFALTYSTRLTSRPTDRADYEDENQIFNYHDEQYNKITTWGAVWNIAFLHSNKNGANTKISLKNLFNVNTNDQFVYRTGQDIVNGFDLVAYNSYYQQNILFGSQLNGEHVLPKSKIRFEWGAAYSRLNRIVPDYRITEYRRTINTNETYSIPFSTNVQPERAGRFYSNQVDNTYSGNFDFVLPFKIGPSRHELKIGTVLQYKDRSFEARQFGYASYKSTASEIPVISEMIMDSVFEDRNMGKEGLYIKEITRSSDAYTASQALVAGYIQLENSLFENKLKFVWGARLESFRQTINTFDFSSGAPINIDSNVIDVLPSLNVIYGINDKMNLRLSGSQTLCRPESRELAPFTFYDYNLFASVTGNPTLKRTRITNADLRYEWYPRGGQLISATAFFKYFENPVEKVLIPAGSVRIFSYINVPTAYNFGFELEYRFTIGSFIEKKHSRFLDDLSFSGNLAYIFSEVNLDSVAVVGGRRPMQGQSPYIINAGLSYNDSKYNFGVSLNLNYIGPRIFSVGNVQYANIIENPRFILDFQLSKTFMKRKLELLLNFRDLVAPTAYFFQDNNGNNMYDDGVDNKMIARTMGQQISFSVGYKF